MVSLYLKPEYKTLERSVMLGPYMVALEFLRDRLWRTIPAAVFNGQCVLVAREPYEFLGGHGALLDGH